MQLGAQRLEVLVGVLRPPYLTQTVVVTMSLALDLFPLHNPQSLQFLL